MTGWQTTLLIALVTGLTAALARLPWLASSPPGFSLPEARAALHARDLRAIDLLLPETGPLDSQEPLFNGLLWLTASLTGWDVAGARLAAALLGIIAAVACALWYRRTLGPLAGLAGGLLAATTFPWLVLSRQAQPAIGAAACATLGLWCLWEGLGPHEHDTDRSISSNRGWWIIAAGLYFGIGLSAHASLLPALIVAPATAAWLIWRSGSNRRDRPAHGWLVAGLACLLLVATPLVVDSLSDPGDLRQRLEQDWNGDGRAEHLAGPLTTASGYGETLLRLGWSGHDGPTLGTPSRPPLDPILLIWSLAGLAVIFTRPLTPLHGVALLWLAGFGLPAALLDPGNPALLMPLTPVLLLLPLLGLRAGWQIAHQRGKLAARLAVLLAIGSVAGSMARSLVAYTNWTQSDTTYFAFNAGLRDALAAADGLASGTTPVYVATTPEHAPLLEYLTSPQPGNEGISTPDRNLRTIDSRTTLIIPADGTGYLITTASSPLSPALLQLLEGQPAIETGTTSEGAVAWQIWAVGQTIRDRLPWTLPALGFPDGFELAGYDIRPDLGDVAASGRLPDPPRVVVTLVWNVPRGATPHIARVRLLPSGLDSGDPEQSATTAESWLTVSPPIAAGNRGRELIIVQMSLPVPDSPDLIVEVQAGLSRTDGSIQPPTNAGPNAVGDYVLLNRVQYVRDSHAPP
ncbi:MAG: glycosyltransferase family 39 protein [Chloroflexota bacterium]|nr:glycosyltransferase family 39 protein [Chloroflexota bacterium]